MMTRIQKAIAALKLARRHLKAAGADPDILAALDALMARIMT
jgi:hypothetical protein